MATPRRHRAFRFSDWGPGDELVDAARDAFVVALISGGGIGAAAAMAMAASMLHLVRRTWHRAEGAAL